jgi:hypothetical protein
MFFMGINVNLVRPDRFLKPVRSPYASSFLQGFRNLVGIISKSSLSETTRLCRKFRPTRFWKPCRRGNREGVGKRKDLCVSDGSGALFLRGFFCRTKKSGNGQHGPEGHAQRILKII